MVHAAAEIAGGEQRQEGTVAEHAQGMRAR